MAIHEGYRPNHSMSRDPVFRDAPYIPLNLLFASLLKAD